MWQGSAENFDKRWGSTNKREWLAKNRYQIWELDMVERLEDGTLIFPGDSVPPLLPITKMEDIAEYLWEINYHLRPDLLGNFEPLESGIQEGDAAKFALDGQEETRGQKLIRGGPMLCSRFTNKVYLGQIGIDKRGSQLYGRKLFDLNEQGYTNMSSWDSSFQRRRDNGRSRKRGDISP